MSSANLANFQKKLKRAHAANMTQNVNNSVDEMLPESQEQQGFEGAFLPSRLNLKLPSKDDRSQLLLNKAKRNGECCKCTQFVRTFWRLFTQFRSF